MNQSEAKKWDEKITDKHFLKQNDFALVVNRGSDFMKQYRLPVALLSLLLLLLLVGVPAYRYYHDKQVQELNEKLYEAKKSLKKEQAYQDILKQYTAVPAANLASVELADYYLDHQEVTKAIEAIDTGLKHAAADIVGTVLVLKKFDILKAEKKFKEAAAFLAVSESQVLPTFVPRLRFLSAEALFDAGDKESAKKIYETLANATQNVAKMGVSDYDADVVEDAKERLTLLNLGML